jgi:hypothetical protein
VRTTSCFSQQTGVFIGKTFWRLDPHVRCARYGALSLIACSDTASDLPSCFAMMNYPIR